MSPGKVSRRIAADRLAWIERMLEEINKLPLGSLETFLEDSRNVFTAESCLRTSLEALFDLGRHILAKRFGVGVTEYKEIAFELERQGILHADNAVLLKILAGYRNRMVHFYHEIKPKELYEICTRELKDVQEVKETLRNWINANPGHMDETL
ncbi:MAG: hypothetical protein CVU57_13455 [Deltaproteobacteria bacterium HGW-Deltaproteobacteria-15]|jgi:uncharacterized protein YutE (UPF0331/DUF86 family)|nr:MAG: hypothetical protein CVU57_13455 [Deltaproteobacteria bacterium HGW-Deltaproteobacteria-15]